MNDDPLAFIQIIGRDNPPFDCAHILSDAGISVVAEIETEPIEDFGALSLIKAMMSSFDCGSGRKAVIRRNNYNAYALGAGNDGLLVVVSPDLAQAQDLFGMVHVECPYMDEHPSRLDFGDSNIRQDDVFACRDLINQNSFHHVVIPVP